MRLLLPVLMVALSGCVPQTSSRPPVETDPALRENARHYCEMLAAAVAHRDDRRVRLMVQSFFALTDKAATASETAANISRASRGMMDMLLFNPVPQKLFRIQSFNRNDLGGTLIAADYGEQKVLFLSCVARTSEEARGNDFILGIGPDLEEARTAMQRDMENFGLGPELQI